MIVRATIGGKVYWLDATRQGDESLDALDVPNLHFALPLTRDGRGLEPLTPRVPAQPYIESHMSVDLAAGLDRPAKIHRETILRGDIGRVLKLALTAASPTDRDRTLRDVLKGGRDWINPDKLDWAYDPETMTFTGTLDGTGAPPFTSAAGTTSAVKDWFPVDDPVQVSADLRRITDYHKDAPYEVAYPNFSRDRVEILLPDGGRGFTLRNGQAIDQDAGGVRYTRTATLNGGRFEAEVSRRALQARFDASQAERVETQLKTLDNYDVSLSYRPGSVKDTPATKAAKTKEEARKRGQIALGAGDPTAAEAAFTEALQSAPDAGLYQLRAVARARMGEVFEARDDLDAAVKLDPKRADALLSLGAIALDLGDPMEARRRFDAAVDAATDRARMDEQIEGVYERADRWADAVIWADRRLADLPKDNPARATALNGACWARAQAGVEPGAALRLCEDAMSLRPDEPAFRDSRALVRLRLGDWSGAASDYDDVLKHGTNHAFALYGRGVAERRLGQTAKADADMAAAKSARPNIEAIFPTIGTPAP